MRRAVFFDRDGVLCSPLVREGRAVAPRALDSFCIEADAPGAVGHIRAAGFLAIVVTNQPELESGELSRESLALMHERLLREVPLDAIYVCPHRASTGCGCHKPQPGLLDEARVAWDIDLRASFLIGDRWRDIEAGRAVGCMTVLIQQPYSGPCAPHYRARDLLQAVSWVLGNETRRSA